jgi:hypothetical protein
MENQFGMERFINGFLDLITIWFRALEKTYAFIWRYGFIMFIIGLISAVYIGFQNYTTCITTCASL